MSDQAQRIENFFTQFTKQEFQHNETIIWSEKEPGGIYYLKEGHVKQYAISEHTGNRLTLHIYHPKSYFPMIWALAEKRNRYFFDAMGSVILYRAPKDKFLQLLRQDPEALFFFSKRLLSGLDGLLMRIEVLAFTDVYGRTISHLLYLSKHFGEPFDQGIILQKMTHQEMADFVGVARETMSIALEKLQKNGLISYQGKRICIPSLTKLVEELNREGK